MFNSIRYLKPEQAVGILADTALKLESRAQTYEPFVDNQVELEIALLQEVQSFLHLSQDDFSPLAIERITDLLDNQADIILSENTSDTTERLSAAGALSSDVYNIIFDANLADSFGWRWKTEERLAIFATKNPHRQQILGNGQGQNTPALTIYGRLFQHRFPARNFWMLVVGRRDGLNFFVSQVWRAYPASIDLSTCETLLDVIKVIASNFGHEITVNGETGSFFWSMSERDVETVIHQIKFAKQSNDILTVTLFHQGTSAVLVIPMNLTKYFKYVEHWRGWDTNLIRDLENMDPAQHVLALQAKSTISNPQAAP